LGYGLSFIPCGVVRFVCSHAGSVPRGTIQGNTKRVERGTILCRKQPKGEAMNVQQWREMSGYVDRMIVVGAHDIGPQDVTVDENGWPSFGVRFWFGRDGAAGGLHGDALLKIGVGQRSFVSCGNEVWWFDSAAEVVEWVEACHIAACFALLEAAGFERGPWGEWHKDGCLIQPHARYGEPRFDIYTPRRPSDWGPLQPPDMKRGDWILYRTFPNLDLQTLLEFRGWPTADEVAADEESDRLAALLSPEHLARIDAVLAEVDAGILPDDGVDADVSLEKVRRAAEG
jgi:hypothetical protein